jgi:hypothetical protein
MTVPISESEAQFALSSIERRRQQVVAEINVPTWYWLFLAAIWASVVVALLVLVGGPTLVSSVRHHAERSIG